MSAPDIRIAWQAIANVLGTVAGVKVVMGSNDGTASDPHVVPLATELVDWPAIVLVPGAWTNTAGGAARISIDFVGALMTPYDDDPGAGADRLLAVFKSLLEVAAAHAKPSGESSLQYVLVTTGPGLQTAKWPNSDTGADYLTWPFELETKFNPNTLAYVAAG